MTTVTVEEFRSHPDQYLADATKGELVLTQNGQPWVVLRSVEDDQDRLSAAYTDSPEFRETIRRRRQEQSIPWEEARKELDLD